MPRRATTWEAAAAAAAGCRSLQWRARSRRARHMAGGPGPTRCARAATESVAAEGAAAAAAPTRCRGARPRSRRLARFWTCRCDALLRNQGGGGWEASCLRVS
eukprot:44013-Chlamydomonas_euryale.AAC.1